MAVTAAKADDRRGEAQARSSRIERVTQPIADGVEGHHRHDDRDAGKERDPPCRRDLLGPIADDASPARRRWLHTEAEKGEAGLEDDDVSDAERRRDDDG